jgi:glycosyltransferase involved in cell wall biosynthesis
MITPLVSIVMPVYNGERYIKEAIESILDQTFEDFELIIVNDGSNDKTLQIIKQYAAKDERIKVISRQNKGVSASRNEAIGRAKGKYIAMQDADDISYKERLRKQVQNLEANSDVGLLGMNYYVIDEKGKKNFTTNVFTNPHDLKLAEIFSNQFGQGTIMARAKYLRDNQYEEDLRLGEDYDLWARLSHVTNIANLAEPLYEWRRHDDSAWSSNAEETRKNAFKIRDREFDYYLAHRDEYRLFSTHPRSTGGGVMKYLKMKNVMLRDMALMYCYRGMRKKAVATLLVAILYGPWVLKTYKQLIVSVFRKSRIQYIDYESL